MTRRKGFAAGLKERNKKSDNHPKSRRLKREVRQKILDEIGADHAVVFDAFAGAGEMYRAVWCAAAKYVGCDTTWYRDGRTLYVADNRRVLRAIDLGLFNIFDLDAYGAPWEQALIVADRRRLEPGERVGLVLTEGSGLNLKLGGVPLALREVAGIIKIPAGASRRHDEIIDRAIAGLCRRMNAVISKRWQGLGKSGAAVRYIGLVIEGKKKPTLARGGRRGKRITQGGS